MLEEELPLSSCGVAPRAEPSAEVCRLSIAVAEVTKMALTAARATRVIVIINRRCGRLLRLPTGKLNPSRWSASRSASPSAWRRRSR